MYKNKNGLIPDCLPAKFTPAFETIPYDLRGSSDKFHIPCPNKEFLKRSIKYDGTQLLNELPCALQHTKSLSFKNVLKTTTVLNSFFGSCVLSYKSNLCFFEYITSYTCFFIFSFSL